MEVFEIFEICKIKNPQLFKTPETGIISITGIGLERAMPDFHFIHTRQAVVANGGAQFHFEENGLPKGSYFLEIKSPKGVEHRRVLVLGN